MGLLPYVCWILGFLSVLIIPLEVVLSPFALVFGLFLSAAAIVIGS